MRTKHKNFKYAIHNIDACGVSKLACINRKIYYTEFTFYGTLHEIASFICDVDNQNNILRMEKKLEDKFDYVYEDYKGHPCTTIFID